ncbi:hypothetical protein D3C85_1714730 [compost metagenome]
MLALLGAVHDALQLFLELTALLLSGFLLASLLVAEAMEQLIELTAHCAYGAVNIGGCLLHQVALLTPY